VSIEQVLRKAADDHGPHTWPAAAIADLANLSVGTAQAWGRKYAKGKRTLCRQWSVSYLRGRFVIDQRTDYVPTPPPTVPEWFARPEAMPDADDPDVGFDVGQRQAPVLDFVNDCMAGRLALAPWQRGDVWTERQQIDLLDSMIRGISIGALTIWSSRDHSTIGRPLPGCPVATEVSWRNHLIVDGQQRATTLIRAACGELDHWRWDGQQWSPGRGFLTPRLAVLGPLQIGIDEHMNWTRLVFDGFGDAGDAVGPRMFADGERVQRTDLDLMVLGGTTEQMVETYRRLATHGSPHSPEDLALMDAWVAARECERVVAVGQT